LTMAENLLDEMIEKCKAKEEEKDWWIKKH
jgi:hypothetical protein